MGKVCGSFIAKIQNMIIFGIHACKSAIKYKRDAIKNVFLLDNNKGCRFLQNTGVQYRYCTKSEINSMVPKNAVHQGIAIDIDDDVYYSNIDIFKNCCDNCVIIILDGVNDPHNLGAIIRSAAAFGAYGIIVPEHDSCKLNGTVIKAASGGIDHIKFCVVKNLASAIKKLKEYGFWIFATCETATENINNTRVRGKTCFIFGAEETGVRRLQKENADFLVKINTNSSFQTLNVSNAVAIALYEVSRQNSQADSKPLFSIH